MSSDAGNSDLNVLATQIAELEKLEKRLEEAIGYGTKVRLALAGLLIVFVLGFTYVLYSAGQKLLNEKQAYIAEVEKRSEPTMDIVMKEVETLAKNTYGPVGEVFQKQADKDFEKYLAAAGAQRDLFVESMQKKLDGKITNHYEKLLAGHEAILKREFPSIKNDDAYAKMIGNFEIAIDRLVKKYYGEEFVRQMDRLYLTWETFPMAKEPPGGKAELEEQLKGHLADLLAAIVTQRNYLTSENDSSN